MSADCPEPGRVVVLAPLGRDAEVACEALGRAGIAACPGRTAGALDGEDLDALLALVLTEELLTLAAVEAIEARLDGQPSWSDLPVILLADPEERRMGAPAAPLKRLCIRAGVVLLERPTRAAGFVSVARAAVLARRRQFRLRDELAAREQAEARARTLADEMRHRVKNAFAVAGGLAAQTFRHARTMEEAQAAFAGRLAAMARAQDLLGEGEGESADLAGLVERAIEPYRPADGPGPFDVEGPAMRVPAATAQALAMGLHELATNASKHGALSVPSGRVRLSWTCEEEGAEGRRLILEWRERGGPRVAPPERRGFGSLLIERALAQDLGGSARLEFRPEGVVCTISAAAFKGEQP